MEWWRLGRFFVIAKIVQDYSSLLVMTMSIAEKARRQERNRAGRPHRGQTSLTPMENRG
jgi:hypothetical protein